MFGCFYRKRGKLGFTLLELLVVMAVLAILVTLGVPRFKGYLNDAAVTAMKSDCKLLETAAGVCVTRSGEWPVLEEFVPESGGVVELLTGAKAHLLNEEAVSRHVRSLKNEYGDYVLVIEGNEHVSEGNIVFIGNSGNGLEDSDKVVWYGINLRGSRSGQENQGDGTQANPFEVWTAEDLRKVGSGIDGWNMDCHYIQMADIDLSGYASGEGWEPIGDDRTETCEACDGSGKLCSACYSKGETFVAAFTGGYDGNGFMIENLTINRPNAEYQGLFGCVQGASLTNIKLEKVDINGDHYVGGMAGGNCGGFITGCYATGSVSGEENVGGLVGENWEGTITGCAFTGSVRGDESGGLVGHNLEGTITGCHATASVSGWDDVGGLVGENWEGTITDCHAAGSVNGGEYVGGLIGYNLDGSVTNSYFNGEVRGGFIAVGGLVGINGGGSITNCHSTGPVSGEECVGGLVGDNQCGFITGCYATGSVSGWHDVGGLLGYNVEGTITGCYATGPVSGDYCVGGLVGMNWEGTITGCYATGSVSGCEYYVGGLLGYNGKGTITGCYATGSVSGNKFVGGLVGENGEGSITGCYATGPVSGNEYVGGLVGINDGTVTSSFWNIETSGQLESDGGEGKTTAEMKSPATYAGWDEAVWHIVEGEYPRLKWELGL